MLKNIFISAALVVGATMATSAAALLAVGLVAASASEEARDFIPMVMSGAIVMGALMGVFFSFVSLTVAAVTMPLGIALGKALRLPRPSNDIAGGGAAGLLCAAIALGMAESVARAKGGGLGGEGIEPVILGFGLLGGCLLGKLRYHVLVAPKLSAPAPALA
jgi:hypothetical protein